MTRTRRAFSTARNVFAVIGVVAVVICAFKVRFITWKQGAELNLRVREEKWGRGPALGPSDQWAADVWKLHKEAAMLGDAVDDSRIVIVLGGD